MVKSLKPIDKQLLLVTIYLEIALYGEFKNEEVRRAAITLWENREHWPRGFTRIFEKWAPAKLQTISVENGTKTLTAVSSTRGDDSAVNDKTFIVIGFLKSRRQSDWWVTWTIVVLMTGIVIKQKIYVSVSCHSSASQVTNYVTNHN